MRVRAPDPDGDARLLERRGEELGAFHRDVSTVVLEGLSRPQAGEDLEPFVELCGQLAAIGRVAVRGVLVGRFAETDAEHEAAAGEAVDGDGLAGELLGQPAGERRDTGAEDDPPGALGDRAEEDPRVDDRHRRRGAAVDVVPEEDAVPAGGLGPDSEVDEALGLGEGGHAQGEAGAALPAVVVGGSTVMSESCSRQRSRSGRCGSPAVG